MWYFWSIRFDVTIVSSGNNCNVKPDWPEQTYCPMKMLYTQSSPVRRDTVARTVSQRRLRVFAVRQDDTGVRRRRKHRHHPPESRGPGAGPGPLLPAEQRLWRRGPDILNILRVPADTGVENRQQWYIETSLSISKNAESTSIARCSEYFDEILVSFRSCMLMELLEQTVKKSEN